MALITSTGEFSSVRNPYNLQTQQKRVRHLRSISVRNLHAGTQGREHFTHLQCYFTLHRNSSSQAFYKSEIITGSTNPAWQSFDISQFEDQIDLTAKFVVVRVWVGQQERFRLLIDMEVHLNGLHVLADKLDQLLVKQSPNTVIFGMLDKEFLFINKDQTRVKNMEKKVVDLHLPSSVLPAVVKVEKSSVRNSYTTSSLSRIQTVLRAIKQMQSHSRRYRRQIEDRLMALQEDAQKLERQEHLHMSVSQLRQELLRRATALNHSQERLTATRDAAADRAKMIENDTETTKSYWQTLQEDKQDYIVKREHLVKENALLNLRRRQMLCELYTFIYPIAEDNGKYFISGVRLPHAEQFQGQDDTMVAVGLGYSCHLTIQISQIQGLPLRHPMENRGSKSVIYDQVHSKLADKDREFPLYSKGKDKYHFNYGVFLLNKNISQLRYQCSIATLDLRQTLQNLQTLLHKLGVRIGCFREGDTSGMQTLTSTPEGTTLSRLSSHGSNITPPSFITSPNGHLAKATGPGPRSGHQPSKTSDWSEDVSVGASVGDGRGKAEIKDHFDEAEDMFSPSGDDRFFKVGSSPIDDFNALGGVSDDGGGGGKMANRDGLDDSSPGQEAQVCAILHSASRGETLAAKTFQLVRHPRTPSPGGGNREGLGMGDADTAGENGEPVPCGTGVDGASAAGP